ncbi:3-dehydroquinate synthase [Spirochaetia bacterium]|nr:3-dehydroquinate synthase [Spirochaetia bacterium]
MKKQFQFGQYKSTVHIQNDIPGITQIVKDNSANENSCILICDTNTKTFADKIKGDKQIPLCVLNSGEETKTWQSVETILRITKESGLGRDSLVIGVGGGVVTDMAAFAASIYMRGVSLALVSTTLLGMADAALGGKTGIDLFNIKNIAGSFYPARSVYMPVSALSTLPLREWKSGLAEIVKTAILNNSIDNAKTYNLYLKLPDVMKNNFPSAANDIILPLIEDAVCYKGRIVEADPKETGGKRVLLNLGHTFAHALESTAGLGALSHGEAVAWGIVCACKLGVTLNITPKQRAEKICSLIKELSYQISMPHPELLDIKEYMKALNSDKKKKQDGFNFVLPSKKSAVVYKIDNDKMALIEKIVSGGSGV